MTTTKSPLTAVLTTLTQRTRKDTHQLERGLMLAYTPGGLNDGRFRLALSRLDKPPSRQELAIIKAALRESLQKQERPFDTMITEPWLQHGRRHYHVIEWRELVQETLF